MAEAGLDSHSQVRRVPARPSFVSLFTPKLVTVLREGYGLRQLRADAIAGLTVAVVALPLQSAQNARTWMFV